MMWWKGFERKVREEVVRIKEFKNVEDESEMGVKNVIILIRNIIKFVEGKVNISIKKDIGYEIVEVKEMYLIGIGEK